MSRVTLRLVGLVGLVILAGCQATEETEAPPATALLSPTIAHTPTAVATATPTPIPLPAPTLTSVPIPEEIARMVTLTVVYDNNPYDPALQTAWGFACWVETPEGVVLFDTGGDGRTLLGNLAQLGLDPQQVDVVVLSHTHRDHTGGLAALLDTGVGPTVYVPAAFPAAFKADVRAHTNLVEVTDPAEILPGIYTTGQVGSGIVEQALVVETGEGWVVVTGCAHPGIVEMVRRAKELTGGKIHLVLGGFHLGGASEEEIAGIIEAFRQVGVEKAAPCHCTGDRAIRALAEEYGDDFIKAGVGTILEIGP